MISMRGALNLAFAKNADEPLLGRLPAPGAAGELWLTYRAVGARVRPLAALLGHLAGAHTPDERHRPFVAIGGPNAVEWLATDWACSGAFLPTVGLHPTWAAGPQRRVLQLTRARVVVLTSVGALKGLMEALGEGGGAPTVEHVVLLDGAARDVAAIIAAEDSEKRKWPDGVKVWRAAGGAVGGEPADAGTVPPVALVALLEGAVGTLPATAPDLPVFAAPVAEWLAQAAAAAEAPRPGFEGKPLFHDIAPPTVVNAQRGSLNPLTRGAAGWVLAAEGGDAEAWLDLVGVWSVLFSTGSSGILKGMPCSRAGWAASSNAFADGELNKIGGNPVAKVVVSHCALSHGLDRGMCWKALMVGGRIGMVGDGHAGTPEVLRAIAAFRPGLFVTMPCFWSDLYKGALEEARKELRDALLRGGVGAVAAAPPPEPLDNTLLEELLEEQLRVKQSLLLALRGAKRVEDWPKRDAAPFLTDASNKNLTFSWCARPHGSLAGALTRVAERLRGQLVLPGSETVMGYGGAALSWEAATFFGWLVFGNGFARFRNYYGATEVPGIADGDSRNGDLLNVSPGVLLRLKEEPAAADPAAAVDPQIISLLEAKGWGTACRYWGADEGDKEASKATADAFTEDGFWRSGDAVEGTETLLRVVGRKKDQLEFYVAGDSKWASASRLERLYAGCEAVHGNQVVVTTSNRDESGALVAVLVPSEVWVENWAKTLPRDMRGSCEPNAMYTKLARLSAAPLPNTRTHDEIVVLHLLEAALVNALRRHGATEEPEWVLPWQVVVDFTPWSNTSNPPTMAAGLSKGPLREAVLKLHQEAVKAAMDIAIARSEAASKVGAGVFKRLHLKRSGIADVVVRPNDFHPASGDTPVTPFTALPGAEPDAAAPAFLAHSGMQPRGTPLPVEAALTAARNGGRAPPRCLAWPALVKATLSALQGSVASAPKEALLGGAADAPWPGLLADLWATACADRAAAEWHEGARSVDVVLPSFLVNGMNRTGPSSPPMLVSFSGEEETEALRAPGFLPTRAAAAGVTLLAVPAPCLLPGDSRPCCVAATLQGDAAVLDDDDAFSLLRAAAAARTLPAAVWPAVLARPGRENALPAAASAVANEVMGVRLRAGFPPPPSARFCCNRFDALLRWAGELPLFPSQAGAQRVQELVNKRLALAKEVMELEQLRERPVALGKAVDDCLEAVAAAAEAVVQPGSPHAAESLGEKLNHWRSALIAAEGTLQGESEALRLKRHEMRMNVAAIEDASVKCGVPLCDELKTGLLARCKAYADAKVSVASAAGDVGAIPVALPLRCRLTHAVLASGSGEPYMKSCEEKTMALSMSAWACRCRVLAALNKLNGANAHGSGDALRTLRDAAAALDPTHATDGAWVEERVRAQVLRYPFTMIRLKPTREDFPYTPTPGAWVRAAFAAWGERPCLGLPAAHCAVDCVLEGADGEGLVATRRGGFAWYSYAQLAPLVHAFAAGAAAESAAGAGGLVAICARSAPEWLLADFGGALAGLRIVGLHNTLTEDELRDAARKCAPTLAVVGAREKEKWLSLLDKGTLPPSLRALVVLQRGGDEELAERQRPGGPRLLTLHALLDEGRIALQGADAYPEPPFERKLRVPDDDHALFLSERRTLTPAVQTAIAEAEAAREKPFTYLFTSGSSGKPKAAEFSMRAWRLDVGDSSDPDAANVTASFIPLSHSSDRIRCWGALSCGGRVGFCFYGEENWLGHQDAKKKIEGVAADGASRGSNNVEPLLLHFAALRPTALALPPQIWAGLKYLKEEAAKEAVGGGGGGGGGDIVGAPLEAARREALQLLWTKKTLFDAFGGRVRSAASGGAPISKQLWGWVIEQMPGVSLQNSFGTTECGAVLADSGSGLKPLPVSSGRALQALKLGPLPDGADAVGYPFPKFFEALVKTPTMATRYLEDVCVNGSLRADPLRPAPPPPPSPALTMLKRSIFRAPPPPPPRRFSVFFCCSAATAAAFDHEGYYKTGDVLEALENSPTHLSDGSPNPHKAYAIHERVSALVRVPHGGGGGGGESSCVASPEKCELVCKDALLEAGVTVRHLCAAAVDAAVHDGVKTAKGLVLVLGLLGSDGVSAELLTRARDAVLGESARRKTFPKFPWMQPLRVEIAPLEHWAPGRLLNGQFKVARAKVEEFVKSLGGETE
jgi:long-subunit acyl-CoA synthetase (AMP-forming)